MNSVALSLRYAKAVFLSAKEKNILETVYNDLVLIRKTIKPVKEFQGIIKNPLINEEKKIQIFSNVFKNHVNKLSLDFLVLIIKKNRENYLLDIIRNFEKLYHDEVNLKEVVVITRNPINQQVETRLKEIVEKLFNASANIENINDDNMIGGIKVKIDNLLLDLSVRTQLEEIRKSLKSEVYKIGF